jgi:hypothetical protein
MSLLAAVASIAALAAPAEARSGRAGGTPRAVDVCGEPVQPGHYRCFAQRRHDLGFRSTKQIRSTAAARPAGLGPADLQSAYHLPSDTAGTGQRVYIVNAYDHPNAEADLATYRRQYGLPPCTTANGCFRKVNQNGVPAPLPPRNADWAGETSMDLDVVSAICPRCGITLVEADDNSDNLFVAVRTATRMGARFVSLSWGGSETGDEVAYDDRYFTDAGVVYAASTGDDAYQGGVSYPASSPDVVAVGGTSLTRSTTSRGWSETVWRNNVVLGTGSGCSGSERKPAWQTVVPKPVCNRRAVADVSAVADPMTGVAVYQSYGGRGWSVNGGTSASAPIIAATYALAGPPARTDKPATYPYARSGDLYDITSGRNGTCSPALLCTAAAGWDGPTGLGTPNGVSAFARNAAVTVRDPGRQSGTVGAATSLPVIGVGSRGGTLTYAASALPPGLRMSASGVVTGTPTTAGVFHVTVTARDSTGATGSTSFEWSIASGRSRCTGQLLNNPGFESGEVGWTVDSGVVTADGVHAHGGRNYGWFGGYGTAHTDSAAQAVTIPAGCSASLTYHLAVETSEPSATVSDRFDVLVNGVRVQSLSNRDAGGYASRSVDLSSYAGKTITVTWRDVENDARATSFFLDDTALTLS